MNALRVRGLAPSVALVSGLIVAVTLSAAAGGQTKGASRAAAAMSRAANALVASLSEEERRLATFPFDVPGRMEWHFVPQDRPGLAIKRMSPSQRKLAHALLQSGLSATGYKKTTAIMSLERVLAEMENNPVRRDPEKYYFSVFGTPSADGTWGWKAEGHHVSLNFTVVAGNLIASTPAFLGANPGEVRQGARKGTRVLAQEEDDGRRLLMSLSKEQRAQAIIDATAYPEIVTGPASKVDALAPVGLRSPDMNAPQRKALLALLKSYANLVAPELAVARLTRLEQAGFDKLAFGWAGGIERGAPHYYRISGPTFIVEYDNTQSDANHVHTVWRDYEGDFGRDLLREHLNRDHAREL